MFPNMITPNNPVIFNEAVCNGCNQCVQLFVMDILAPNPEKGKPPVILYPDERYYDGLCVKNCPLWQKGQSL
ncbi:ferredoxin family protein [Chloroflexota bacterium]